MNPALESGVWQSAIYFEPMSISLYASENMFILEDVAGSKYFPNLVTGDKITARWDGTETAFFVYEVLIDNLTSEPYINRLDYFEFVADHDFTTTKAPLQINVAFNPVREGIHRNKLMLYLNDVKFMEVQFYGEGVDEDERFNVWLQNFGIKFNREDALLLKDYDIKEAYPDWNSINTKRKEILVNKEEIFPYIGTYRGLMNLIKIMGYSEVLKVKEYWKNVNQNSSYFNRMTLVDISYMMSDEFIDSSNNTVLNAEVRYNKDFKLQGMLALSYQFLRESGDYDADGVPITEYTSDFTIDEVFYKLRGIKKMLEQDFLPANVYIKDIMGEFLYFFKYTFKTWRDATEIFNYDVNERATMNVYPDAPVAIVELSPLFKKNYPNGIDFPKYTFNTTAVDPFYNDQFYGAGMPDLHDAIRDFYTTIGSDSVHDNVTNERVWEYGDDFEMAVGAPVAMEFVIAPMTVEDLGNHQIEDLGTIDDSGPVTIYDSYFTWENVEYRNIYEIEWHIELVESEEHMYRFTYREYSAYSAKFAHILPHPGKYKIKWQAFDLMGGASFRHELDVIVVVERPLDLVAFSRLEDKFDYHISNLYNVMAEDFGSSTWDDPRVNVLWQPSDKMRIRTNLTNWRFYRQHMDNAKIFDPDNVWRPYADSILGIKRQWGIFGDKFNLTIDDLADLKIDDVYYYRGVDTVFRETFLSGFSFTNPHAGDVLQFTGSVTLDQIFPAYTITTDDLFALRDVMNASSHPVVSLFTYEVIGDRIQGNAKEFGWHTYHNIRYLNNSGQSPSIDGDAHTFFTGHIFNEDILTHLEDNYPLFDRDLLFTNAPTDDIVNGLVNDDRYWIDNKYFYFDEDGNMRGYIPSVLDAGPFDLKSLKVYYGGFWTVKCAIVIFAINNISGVRECEWTLLKYHGADIEDEVVIKVKDVPFFIWRFDQTGMYKLTAMAVDTNGNVYTNWDEQGIEVLENYDYVTRVNKRINTIHKKV